MTETGWGLWALLPLALTLGLALVTRSALLAMLIGTAAGTLMLDAAPGVGLNELFQSSLGNPDFIWICQIVLLIGVLFELFKRAGVLGELTRRLSRKRRGRRGVALTAWSMGFLIVDDYFSPLLTGAIVRPMSDRVRIPREKLAFILDSTTASVCILVPFTAWGAYLASLIAAQGGPVSSVDEGLAVFVRAIPYNFYPLLLLVFTLLICAGALPDFGPMRKAERRVARTGEVLRPGARPLVSDQDDVDLEYIPDIRPSLSLELLLPVVILVTVGAGTLIATGSVRIVEAFLLANTCLIVTFVLRGRFERAGDVGDLIVAGARSVMEALLIVALAYALNAVTGELGAADVIVERFSSGLAPGTLVATTFFVTALVSFSTGTSWGAYAMMMPLALPSAYALSDAQLTPLVYQTVAAVAGGGIFGDHASPVSDTTVLSSVGAGSDHIDHVITQLPYAVLVAVLAFALYLALSA